MHWEDSCDLDVDDADIGVQLLADVVDVGVVEDADGVVHGRGRGQPDLEI